MPENINNQEEKNKVDGIKKFSGVELAKSRKIVLEVIGENKKSGYNEPSPIISQPDKMVDSLISKNSNQKIKESKPNTKNSAEEKKIISEDQKNNLLKAIGAEEENNSGNLKIINNLKSKLKMPPISSVLNNNLIKTAKNYAPDFKNIRPLVDELANNDEPFKKINKPADISVRSKDLKVGADIKATEKINGRNKAGLDSQKNVAYSNINNKKIKFKFKNFFNDLFRQINIIICLFKINLRKTLLTFLIGFFSFILLYFIFIFLVLKLNLDNKFFRIVENILPIPALIYDNGIISYYSYKDLKTDYASQNFNENTNVIILKNSIIKNILLNKLLYKYKIMVEHGNYDNYEEKIGPLMVYDMEINQVAINRINKIKNMIVSNEDFLHISEKYGDEQGQKTITVNELETLKYKNKIRNLSLGGISPIIAEPEGYYLYRLNSKTESVMSYNYIFVKAKTLEEYLNNVK